MLKISEKKFVNNSRSGIEDQKWQIIFSKVKHLQSTFIKDIFVFEMCNIVFIVNVLDDISPVLFVLLLYCIIFSELLENKLP